MTFNQPEYKRQWAKDNADKVRASRRKWYENNREKAKEIISRWNQENPEKVLERQKRYAQRNQHKRTALQAKRKARIKNATPAWANFAKIQEVYLLASQLTKETGIQHEVDHIVPISGRNVCGLHVEYNLQAIPARENHMKYNKWESYE